MPQNTRIKLTQLTFQEITFLHRFTTFLSTCFAQFAFYKWFPSTSLSINYHRLCKFLWKTIIFSSSKSIMIVSLFFLHLSSDKLETNINRMILQVDFLWCDFHIYQFELLHKTKLFLLFTGLGGQATRKVSKALRSSGVQTTSHLQTVWPAG